MIAVGESHWGVASSARFRPTACVGQTVQVELGSILRVLVSVQPATGVIEWPQSGSTFSALRLTLVLTLFHNEDDEVSLSGSSDCVASNSPPIADSAGSDSSRSPVSGSAPASGEFFGFWAGSVRTCSARSSSVVPVGQLLGVVFFTRGQLVSFLQQLLSLLVELVNTLSGLLVLFLISFVERGE